MKFAALFALALLSTIAIGATPDSKPMTNQDVIGLVRAKLSDDVIESAIKAAAPAFDTSTAGIIKLNTAKVPQSIIKAMIDAGSAQASATKPSTSAKHEIVAVPTPAFNPEDVVLVSAANRTTMRSQSPQSRVATKFGFGATTYATLSGVQAQLRLKNTQPSFLLAIASSAQPDGAFTLASLLVRKDTREVAVGGGGMTGIKAGIPKDHVIAATAEKLPDQAGAPKGYELYTVNVSAPLPAGEYAFIMHTGKLKAAGYFGEAGDSYFDFGVDH
jgi:hypothetical protein